MSAPKFTPWKVGGRVGATAREGLVGLYAIDRAEPNKYQGPGVGYAHSLADAKLAAAAPELYAALERCLPLLVQLGDFIGNGPINPNDPNSIGERCDAIDAARSALGKAGWA